MNTKLLCIDSLEDYDLIDCDLLRVNGVEVIFTSKKEPADNQRSYVQVSSFDYDSLYDLCKKTKPDYIACFSEDLFVDVASIRSALNIKGMSVEVAKLLSYKNLMYEKIDGKFSYPKTTKIDEQSDFCHLQKTLNSKEVFIKPINMGGSYETYHVKDEAGFNYFLENRKEDLNTYIAQTYINADLYHSELVISNGEVVFCTARKYSFPNHLMVSKNIPIFSLNIGDQSRYKKIVDASIQIVRLFGINNGIFHTEFFLDKEGSINFIETNARAPGIGLNRLYWNKLSLSLETLLCFIVCGKKTPKFNELDNVYVCGYYPLKPGTVKTVVKPELNVESQWTIYVKPNETTPAAKHMSKAAMFICWDKSSEKIDEATRLLSNHNVIEVY
ncbi:acetyl-CoA carboxylase biotin carboxylase subunit family protein [Legionella sp. km772]|uniref:ATP-grasp domain-containing protein n=1 Tax=Legionella sp. km772 TaxID=2498111 RepID=UPI000F8DDFE8|nr:ATP-grasp domain-containing protein [Legionella sp. km772]RUR14108.1 ATP-grasp domain-containing protein [Legionella sp. km772]